MKFVNELSDHVFVNRACKVIGLTRSSWYRRQKRKENKTGEAVQKPRKSHRAITEIEKKNILDILNSPEFIDMAPAEIYATLLDRGQYYCSIRSIYRILEENRQVKERRRQLIHPVYKKPELLAVKPNQLWSWDITKLKGPVKWTYFSLYVILDVFSRYVVGWMVALRESATLAKKLIESSCQKQNIQPDELTIHADRGSSMKSKFVAHLLSDLGVTKTHSRPHVSNDNPYSESQFKTLKYRPDFPERFGCIQDARNFLKDFFAWYNYEHCTAGFHY